MLARRLSHLVTPTILAMAFVAFAGLAGGSVAQAQGRYCDNNRNYQQFRDRDAFRRHQQRERFIYGNSYSTRFNQQREREEFRRRQRIEQFRYLMNGNRRVNGYGRFSDCRRRF
ncbi:MAG TPA: hypothetical protein VJ810_10400 [Blastocatellia bacterium]|nr:hypothetical protein [Blastocatellia bacterium]